MKEQLQQRLVGAMVLVALAIIFLPSLFYRDKRVTLDATTEIPPAPAIDSVVVAPAVKPDSITLPDNDGDIFQPGVVGERVVGERVVGERVAGEPAGSPITGEIPPASPTLQADPEPVRPGLTGSGLPKSWVVQVGSFKSSDGAEKLVGQLTAADFTAYSKPIVTEQGEFTRVFVGPFIDQQEAIRIKQKVDREYNLESQVLRFNPVSGK